MGSRGRADGQEGIIGIDRRSTGNGSGGRSTGAACYEGQAMVVEGRGREEGSILFVCLGEPEDDLVEALYEEGGGGGSEGGFCWCSLV